MNHLPKSSTNASIDDETTSSVRLSDSSISLPNKSSYQDYFSKIDQQIQSTKKTLQSLDIKDHHDKYKNISIFFINNYFLF